MSEFGKRVNAWLEAREEAEVSEGGGEMVNGTC